MSGRKRAKRLTFRPMAGPFAVGTLNSTWSWWTRARAVAVGGRTHVASVTVPGHEVVVDTYQGRSLFPTRQVIGVLPGVGDDHDNAGIFAAAGRPAIFFYNRHNDDTLLRFRRSGIPIEQGIAFTEVEQAINVGAPTTYANAHAFGTSGLVVVYRLQNPWRWGVVISRDNGETFEPPRSVLAFGDVQFYTASMVRGTTLRLAASSHPDSNSNDQRIYYVEVDLVTGAVRKSDGTVLGNLDGTNLPLIISSLEVAWTPPAAAPRTWVYDVGDAPDPEIVVSASTLTDPVSTARYQYIKRVAGAWQDSTIAPCGGVFSAGEQFYLGGAQLVPGAPGRVLLSREQAGTWYVERAVTSDGQSWQRTVLGQSSSLRLVRVWPVERFDNTRTFEAVGNAISRWATFTDHDSTLATYGYQP